VGGNEGETSPAKTTKILGKRKGNGLVIAEREKNLNAIPSGGGRPWRR